MPVREEEQRKANIGGGIPKGIALILPSECHVSDSFIYHLGRWIHFFKASSDRAFLRHFNAKWMLFSTEENSGLEKRS